MRTISFVLFGLCFILFSVSSLQAQSAQWTILVYMNGDNNLETFGLDDFLEMSDAGSTDELNIIVQFDRAQGYDNRFGDWTECHRFRLLGGMLPLAEESLMALGEVDMGDPKTLVDFVSWGLEAYPAEHYFVVIWNHGGGWTHIEVSTLVNNYLNDISSRRTTGIINKELGWAVQQIAFRLNRKIDLWGFDSCMMHMLEVLYEIKDYAEYMIASEEVVGGQGWDYRSWLLLLRKHPYLQPINLARLVSRSYYSSGESTLSVSDLSKVDNTVQALNEFAQALLSAMKAGYSQTVQNIIDATQDFGQSYGKPISDYIDLYDFAERSYSALLPTAVNTAAQNVLNALDDMIISNYAKPFGYFNAHGVAIYHPHPPDFFPEYRALKFTQNSLWDDYLTFQPPLNPPYQPTGIVYSEYPALQIPDNDWQGVSDTIFVELMKNLDEINLQLDLTHPYIGDLKITLTSPLGTAVLIHNKSGGSGSDLRTWFDYETNAAEKLKAFAGSNCHGTWTVTVSDQSPGDAGILNSWKLELK